MKIFFATLATETNTFSPIPTGYAGFTAQGYYRRDGSLGPTGHGNLALQEWRKRAEADGLEIVESMCAFAQPAGTTLRVGRNGTRGPVQYFSLTDEFLRAEAAPSTLLTKPASDWKRRQS